MNFRFEEAPQAVLDSHPEWLELYKRAWELAAAHVKNDPAMPAPRYMDEGFSPTRIWIWDTCFMTFYCKYAPQLLPGIESLDNFYKPMHDGVKSPIKIHHPDNPPLFAWAEYEYWRFTGDASRLARNLVEKRYLQKHFEFIESLDTADLFPFGGMQTNLRRIREGYVWSGCASGMDNTPRGEDHSDNIFWIDAIAQQALSARLISEMAEALGETKTAKEFKLKFEELSELIEKLYFDEKDGSYYDLYICNLTPCRVLTPASFWPLLAKTASPERAKRQIMTLKDPQLLGGEIPFPSVARNSKYFEPDGRYWRGGVWMPTSYMGIRSLLNYGELDLAAELAERTIDRMQKTFKNVSPSTIWEAYSPSEDKPSSSKLPGSGCRADFCGWSALGPISMLIENVLGFHQADARSKHLCYHHRPGIGRHGVKNFRFGDIVCDAVCDKGVMSVKTNKPFTLDVDGKELHCPAGESRFELLKAN